MIRYTCCYLFLLLLTFACSDKTNSNLPDASGKLGTLLVVGDKAILTELNPLIDSIFLSGEGSSSQSFYELVKVQAGDFSGVNSKQRTVLVLVDEKSRNSMSELLKAFTKEQMDVWMNDSMPNIQSQRNLFAKYQHLAFVFGKNARDLRHKLDLAAAQLSNMLLDGELQSRYDQFLSQNNNNDTLTSAIRNELGLAVIIPSGFNLKYHSNKTWWFESRSSDSKSNGTVSLVMHSYPYQDSSDLGYFSIRSVRDSICKYLFRGEIPGTYMSSSESNYYPEPAVDKIKINGIICTKVKGWWTVKGISQSGPYIRYVVPILNKKMIFVFEGFINKDKINFKDSDLRLIESIALSIK